MSSVIDRGSLETRLANGESLRAIAKSLGVSYQTLQYHRRKWGCEALRASTATGEAHPSWKGGSRLSRGYRMVRTVGGYTAEHALVAERTLGRRLTADEVVHHIDGNKLNNDPSNLHVCTRSQHRLLHAQLESIAFALLNERMTFTPEHGYRL